MPTSLTITNFCDGWETLTNSERHSVIHELDIRDSYFRELVKDELDMMDEGDLDAGC